MALTGLQPHLVLCWVISSRESAAPRRQGFGTISQTRKYGGSESNTCPRLMVRQSRAGCQPKPFDGDGGALSTTHGCP